MDLNQQRFVDWDGLVYYDSKIKNYIQDRDTIGLKMGGIIEFKDLPDPSFENLNYIYKIADAFVTNSDFVESDVAYNAGTWVQCANRDDTYYYIIFNDNITETISALKSQVVTLDTNKLEKIQPTEGEAYTQVYSVDKDGNQGSLIVHTGASPNSVVMRGAYGQIQSAEPSADAHVATKAYVDKQDKTKLDKTPDGIHNLLDENNKINTDYLSDVILGQLKFGGTLSYDGEAGDFVSIDGEVISSNWGITPSTLLTSTIDFDESAYGDMSGQPIPVLDGNPCSIRTSYSYGMDEVHYVTMSDIPEGFYFIFSGGYNPDESELFSFAGIDFEIGDWALVTNGTWQKVDNTDAVRMVNGKIGNVVLTGEDISLSKNNNQKLNTIIENKLNKILPPFGDTYTRLYSVDSKGNQGSVVMRVAAAANAVVQRDTKGQLQTPLVPTSDAHATSKNYVDNIKNQLISNFDNIKNTLIDDIYINKNDFFGLSYGGNFYNDDNRVGLYATDYFKVVNNVDVASNRYIIIKETNKFIEAGNPIVITEYPILQSFFFNVYVDNVPGINEGEVYNKGDIVVYVINSANKYQWIHINNHKLKDVVTTETVNQIVAEEVDAVLEEQVGEQLDAIEAKVGAIEDKVDAIQIPDVSNFVTTEQLEEAIASVEHPTVDLTNYYTKEETNSAIQTAINGIDIPEVNLDPYATKEQLVEQVATKADDIPFKTDMFVTNPLGQFVTNDNLNGMSVKAILVNLLGLKSSITPEEPEEPDVPPVDESIVSTIINNKMPMYSVDNDNNLTAHEFTVMSLTEEQAAAAPEQSGFYQIVKDGNVIESGYQDLQIVNDETYYVIALPKILDYNTSVRLEFYDEDEQIWSDGEKLALVSDASTVNTLCEEAGIDISHIDTDTYTVWALEDICTGSKLRYIIVEDN